MDIVQAIASATQIVSSLVSAISALEQASQNLNEAPKKLRVLDDFVSDLRNLAREFKQKCANKSYNPQLERQIQSLNELVQRLHLNTTKAHKIVSKSKTKSFAKVVWSSMVGDPLLKLVQSMREDLNWWMEFQRLTCEVEKVINSTAENVPSRLKINAEQGFPMYNKCHYVKRLLEQEDSHRVILIVGLSGMGKSCLARQVASDPSSKFVHGAVEIGFGWHCSRAACNGSRAEYHKRLVKKLCRFLVQIGFIKNIRDEMSMDLEDVCCLLQTALLGKSILILLEDVWEQDIVERFTKLYDNNCRYLVTTRNEAIYEITEAEKMEICKDDIREISEEILRYHCLLSTEELPIAAKALLDRCGHHPLTVAVMGKALRKETRAEKWEKAICDLSTYATCAPGPVSYVNEKKTDDTLTIFRSFEFSLEAMPQDSQRFFIVLAAISWAEPVPESCLEALWSVLGQESVFPLVTCKLVEGSLLIKMDSHSLYHVHDMVSLYLDAKISSAIDILFTESLPDRAAFIAPWLLIFGKESIQMAAEEKITFFLTELNERHVVISLDTIVQALMASKSISELEASRNSFSQVLGPRVAGLIFAGSEDLIVAVAKVMTVVFTQDDYCNYAESIMDSGGTDKLTRLLEGCNDTPTQIIVSNIVAKLAEYGNMETISKILRSIPMKQLAELLAPNTAEWHESVFATLMSLTNAGKSKAVEEMMASGVGKRLFFLLESGSEVSQHYAIITLKKFYELGVPLEHGSLLTGRLNLLPWNVRISLERFVLPDRKMHLSPKLQLPEDFYKILERDDKQFVEAMQDLIPIAEKTSEPSIRDMILGSHLIERLAFLLQQSEAEGIQARSQSTFLLMKLACSGGEPVIQKFLQLDIVVELVKMMQCNSEELQDSAYTTLHQIIFGTGGSLVLIQILQEKLLERLTSYLDSKSSKTKEVSMLFLIDLVEVGTKPFIEKMFSLQGVERLVSVERAGGDFTGTIVRFLKALDKCKNLSAAERWLMKKQAARKVKAAVKGHKIEARLVAAVEAYISEGPKGSSSRRHRN